VFTSDQISVIPCTTLPLAACNLKICKEAVTDLDPYVTDVAGGHVMETSCLVFYEMNIILLCKNYFSYFSHQTRAWGLAIAQDFAAEWLEYSRSKQ